MAVEVACEIGDTLSLEVEVVHVDIQALFVEYIEVFFGILQEECGLSDPTRTFDTDHAVVPVDLIHENATNWSIDVLNEVSVRPEKSFHSCLICFVYFIKWCKGKQFPANCKV